MVSNSGPTVRLAEGGEGGRIDAKSAAFQKIKDGGKKGEGCFVHRQKKRSAPKICVSCKDEDVTQRAAELLGSTYWRYRREDPFADMFATELSGVRAIAVMRRLLPLMGRRRAAKIAEILQAEEEFQPKNLRFRKTCKHGHPFDKIIIFRGKPLRKCSICTNRIARKAYRRKHSAS